MGKFSKDKGRRGERELASVLRNYGYDCRRSVQYCGANGDADVVGLPDIHIECKRNEHLNLYDAMSQSRADSTMDEFPVVMHRKNNSEWLVTMTLADWIELYEEYQGAQNEEADSTLSGVQEKER